jgi:hypothetical protein
MTLLGGGGGVHSNYKIFTRNQEYVLESENSELCYWQHSPTQQQKTTNFVPRSASELYRPSDRRMSAKLVQTFEDRRCHVVNVMDP